uniref:Uncharacterized protein n=1 Tax=Arundo donax TaxID=35708 RepID=A0A0A9G4S0_ARUDO
MEKTLRKVIVPLQQYDRFTKPFSFQRKRGEQSTAEAKKILFTIIVMKKRGRD